MTNDIHRFRLEAEVLSDARGSSPARRGFPWLAGLLGLGLALAPLAPAWAWAQGRSDPPPPHRGVAGPADPPVSGKVSVRVMVVHAHNDDDKIAPELRGLESELRFLKFSGFRVLETHPSQLSPGSDSAFPVAGGRRMTLDLISRDARHAKVRVRMFKGEEKIVDTTVSIPRNKSFIILGMSYKGGKLVFPITATY